ncbi:AI-2E family transporter [Paeniglutamicibacter antarcticus]|uniref:AI-2E family transporter n=1 Tax=Paeniglutamicibacter antarcticus TaxID=494023 RepID=A0ABP9TN97_9MICC
MPVSRNQPPAIGRTGADGVIARTGERARHVLFIVILAGLTVYGMLQVSIVVIPILLALILAAAISPFVRWLRHHHWPPALATATAFILLIAVFGAMVSAIVSATRAQWDSLVFEAVQRIDKLYLELKDSPLPVDDSTLNEVRTWAQDLLYTRAAGTTAIQGLITVSEVVTGFVLMAVILFFFLKDGGLIWAFFIQRLQGPRRAKTRLMGIHATEVLGGYVRGTAIIAVVDAAVIGATLLFLRVPLALPLAVLIFVGAFIPIVGATVTGVLAALVALVSNGLVDALIVGAAIVVVSQLEGNFLQPVVMGRTLSIHPLVILLALTVGTVLGGILGAILAVPLTAVGWAIIQVWVPASPPAPGEAE